MFKIIGSVFLVVILWSIAHTMTFTKYVALMLLGFSLLIGYRELGHYEKRTEARRVLTQRCDALAVLQNDAADAQAMPANNTDSYAYQRAIEDLHKATAAYEACVAEERNTQ